MSILFFKKGVFYMKCAFFGHRDAPSSIKPRLDEAIFNLISNGVDEFYVGNNGNFDLIVQNTLLNMIEKGERLKLRIVLSRIGEIALSKYQEYTIFPEGQEEALPKFAISKRNEWIINKADILIVYSRNSFSNTWKIIKKAETKGKRIIKL